MGTMKVSVGALCSDYEKEMHLLEPLIVQDCYDLSTRSLCIGPTNDTSGQVRDKRFEDKARFVLRANLFMRRSWHCDWPWLAVGPHYTLQQVYIANQTFVLSATVYSVANPALDSTTE